MADPKEVAQRDKVFRVGRVTAELEFCDPSYELRLEQCAEITPTGRLKLFELVARAADMPSFSGRWDENAQTIDLDAAGLPAKEWKYEKVAKKAGHAGHHTESMKDREVLAYRCDLKVHHRDIFRAIIELAGLWIQKHVTFAVKEPPSLSASAKVILRPK